MVEFAVVTGASSGVGLELTKQLLSLHVSVICILRNTNSLTTMCNALRGSGFSLNPTVDGPSSAQRDSTTATTRELHSFSLNDDNSLVLHAFFCDLNQNSFAMTPLADSLCNDLVARSIIPRVFYCNAGTGSFGRYEDSDIQEKIGVFQVNLLAPILLSLSLQRRFPRLQVSFTSSCLAFLPGPSYALYYATKAALSAYVRAGPSSFSVTHPSPIRGTAFYENPCMHKQGNGIIQYIDRTRLFSVTPAHVAANILMSRNLCGFVSYCCCLVQFCPVVVSSFVWQRLISVAKLCKVTL